MAAQHRNETSINVHQGGNHIIRDEFGNMRNQFEAEMRRVESEMQRLRQEFEHQEKGYPNSSIISQLPTHAPTQAAPAIRQEFSDSAVQGRYHDHLDRVQSPLIQENTDGKRLKLRFDVSGYAPEEVTVKTIDNRLVVQALHEERGPGKSVHREFNQDFVLPQGTNPELITSSLSVDGVLTVEAPVPKLAIRN